MEITLSSTADALMSICGQFACSLEKAWESLHPAYTDNFDFNEVKAYIERKVELGRSLDDILIHRERGE